MLLKCSRNLRNIIVHYDTDVLRVQMRMRYNHYFSYKINDVCDANSGSRREMMQAAIQRSLVNQEFECEITQPNNNKSM